MTKQKHYKEIIAWAGGAEIEIELQCCWVYIDKPTWESHRKYRVKPKPDVEKFSHILIDSVTAILFNGRNFDPNVKYTFNGDTNELIAVEMIK